MSTVKYVAYVGGIVGIIFIMAICFSSNFAIVVMTNHNRTMTAAEKIFGRKEH